MQQVLSDVLVVELSQEPAGEYCSKVFADLGADVIKVEPVAGDPVRADAPAFAHLNTNKRSIVVDDDTTLLRDVLHRADLVVESKGKGDLEALGLSVADARARAESLVVTTISGFGATGPYASYQWSDIVVQAAAGALLAARPPVRLPGMVALATVGHIAAVGGLSGVLRARASGAGAHVDCSAVEALSSVPNRVGRYLGWEYAGRADAEPLQGPGLTLIPIGIFPCGDGYVAMLSTPQQLPEMLDVLDDDALREAFAHPDAYLRPETKEALDLALYPWLLARTRAEITQAAQARGWPLAGVLTPQEVLVQDHNHQRGYWAHVDDPAVGHVLLAGSPYRHPEGGWQLRRHAPSLGEHQEEVRAAFSAPAPPATARGTRHPDTPPADGVRVLDLTTVWSGPFVTQLLADLGAEVIRVENPSVFPPSTKGYTPRPSNDMVLGAMLAMYAPVPDGVDDRPFNRHAMNNSIARNKLSCTLDPRREEARELLFRLVEHADVVIENLKVSTLHRMGVHESELLERNPRLVVVRIPPAGLTGDWAHFKGFGAQFDGLSGFASLTGHAGTQLVDTPSTMHMDAATGGAGAFAVLSALHYRDATGRGGVLELAQMENVMHQLGDVFVQAQVGPPIERLGNRDATFAPQGLYQCRGERARWLAVTVADDAQWVTFARMIGRDDLADDARLADAAGRREHHDELDDAIGAWAAAQDADEAFHALQAAGIAACPDFTYPVVAADPNFAAREWIRPLAGAEVGEHPHLGHAFRGLPMVWRRASPALGEDNEYVFKKILGLSDVEYDQLEADHVIVRDYLDAEGNPV
jgi:crotonobetainyl-CoA:carnitine CoA-transferase CaiB-like acyl-CoA transferase